MMIKRYDFMENLGKYDHIGPLILRLFMGLVFIIAGYSKLGNIAGVTQFFSSLGIPLAGFSAWLVALVEFVGGIALILGFATRYFSSLLAIIMAVATYTTKIPAGIVEETGVWSFTQFFGAARLDLVLLAVAISLMFTGAGKCSLDRKICDRG